MRRHLPLIVLLGIMLCWTMSMFAQNSDPRMWSIHYPKSFQFYDVPPGNLHYKNPNNKIMHFLFGDQEVDVNPNFRVHPSNYTQSEVPLTRGSDPNLLFGSANTFATNLSFGSEGVYVSTDGGNNWFGSDTCAAAPITDHGGDPGPGVGPDGTLYMSYLPGSYNSIKVSRSTDYGTTWATGHVLQSGSMDKNLTGVDNIPGSPYLGNAYVVWSDFTQGAPPITVSHSTDDGTTWATYQHINTPAAGHYSQGCDVAVGPGGLVEVTWANPITGGNYTEDNIGFATSTDGGVTWTANNVAYDCNGVRGNLANKSGIRVNGFPRIAIDNSGGPRNGWVYIVTNEKNLAPAGSDPDIIMHVSTDNGSTWSPGIRVNQDAVNNGIDQYMPAVCVGADGAVNVIYYDSRNTSTDSAEVYVSRSVDGGATFDDFLVSDHRFKPKPIAGLAVGYQGDYIGIVESDGTVYPYWCDDITGVYQAWTTQVTFGPPCPVVAASNPNPASGSMDVSVSLSQLSWTNGANSVTNETYFGTSPGSLSLVQSGSLASSWNINQPLMYDSTYYWKIVELGDTCNRIGPVWSFKVEQNPDLHVDTLFYEPFPDLNNWTIAGPLGLTNWFTSNSTNAGGTPPELEFSWTPSFNGDSYIVASPVFTGLQDSNLTLEFLNYVNFYATPCGPIGAAITTDGGATFTSIYQSSPTASYGPEMETVNFTGVANFQLAFYYTGDSFNINFWYIDNVGLYDIYVTPVEMTAFTAAANNDKVILNWATATETNNRGFEVERKGEKGIYSQVGYVGGFGTTTEPKSYTFTDSKVATGNYTYRLKQIDFNGTIHYSNEVEVSVNAPATFALDQNYPNPFNPTTMIHYSIPADQQVALNIYNLLGQKVMTLVNEVQKAGQHEVNFNASNLASGVYFYKLEAGQQSSIKKMILMK
jgi:Secretion system C-terminal sorting domain